MSCMNRSKNLLESLASWVDSHKYINDIIIIDWSSSIPLFEHKIIKEYLHNQKITLIRVEGEDFYSISKSLNLAAQNAKNNILLKLDADYKSIKSSWIDNLYINEKNKLGSKYFIHGQWEFSKSLNGFLLVNKSNFLFYNENMSGWGYEDTDAYNRIAESGIRPIIFFNIKDYIKHLDHPENDRVINYKTKDRKISADQNKSIANKPFELSKFETISEDMGYKILRQMK